MRTIREHSEEMSTDDAIEHIIKLTGASQGEAREMNAAVRAFSSAYYEEIRAYQQTGVGESNIAKYAADVDKFIERAPKWNGGVTYRGIRLKPNEIAAINVGDTIGQNGTSSWSTKVSTAESFSGFGGAQAVIFVNEGIQRHGTSIKFTSLFAGENEVTASSKARWTVVSKERIGGTFDGHWRIGVRSL